MMRRATLLSFRVRFIIAAVLAALWTIADAGAEPARTLKTDGTSMIDNTMISDSLLVPGNAYRIAAMMERLSRGGRATIAFIGGSITQGSAANPQSSKCYAAQTRNWFKKTWPEVKFTSVNAGIGATGSFLGVHRAGGDVISKNPDIVFVDFSVNDKTETIDRDLPSYDALMRKLWNAPSKPAIVAIAMTQDSGESVQEYHRKVAEAYGIPMISYRNAVLGAIRSGSFSWTDIAADNIHPNNEGHRILADLLAAYLESVRMNSAGLAAGAEPSLPQDFAVSSQYANAAFISPASVSAGTAKAEVDTGCFSELVPFGNMKGDCWRATAEAGSFGGKSCTVTVRAKNVALFYGKENTPGTAVTSAIVTVKGSRKVSFTIDTSFAGWTGSYVESLELVSGESEEDYTITVTPDAVANGMFVIAGIGAS
jgi:lysophospholipase L1-like esterase